jgi:hypothetical protein
MEWGCKCVLGVWYLEDLDVDPTIFPIVSYVLDDSVKPIKPDFVCLAMSISVVKGMV